ncbi:MAG: DNA topoisomerase [Eubacteriales bacterium]|nr:DNA topoisomerase [Eubacteriales bacterium]
MSILVITEKPSVARMVAQALSCHEKCGGYIKGEGYIISWCFGHLIRKAAPEAYDMMYKKWDLSMLPIIPERWIHEVIPQTKEQFKTLKTLMADPAVEQVCCCTDCGREGQLIFQLVYDMAGCRKPVSRFWASSLEEEAIRKAFSSLRDGNEFIPLYQAAECRAEADWLIGMNLTRLYSLKYGNGRVLNIGRVKSPTLSLLAERETQISDFVKEPYYVTHLIMGDIDAVSPRISDKRKAEQMAEKLKNSQACFPDTRLM